MSARRWVESGRWLNAGQSMLTVAWLAMAAVIVVSLVGLAWWFERSGPAPAQLSENTAPTHHHRYAIGAVVVVSMLAMLVVYRFVCGRLRGLSVVGECLREIDAGETDITALRVDDKLGTEAVVWNRIAEQTEQLRRAAVIKRSEPVGAGSARAMSDLDIACDSMPQGMVLVTRQMTVEYANGAAAAFLQRDREGLAGQPVEPLIEFDQVRTALRDIVEGRTTRRTIAEEQRADERGRSVLRYIVRPVRNVDDSAAMLIIEDVTQQREAELARHSFVAHATHELRTPLTNIRAYVETAIDEPNRDERVIGECLNVINSEVLRLDRLIGDLLSVSEVEAGGLALRHDDIDLATILRKLENDFRAQADERQIVMEFSLPAKLPTIQGDRDKVAVALNNLIGNALKYTPQQGSVRVVVTTDENQVRVDVIDTGIGIKQEELEKVFEKFYRASDPRVNQITGTGLGLTLSREVIRLHSGDITVESQPDQGSTFTLTLPVTAAVGVGE